MPNSIKLLCEIQKIDLELDAIDKEEERYRRKLESAGKELERIDEETVALRGEVEALSNEKKDKEDVLRQKREKIEKDKQRLSEITNDRQYKAVTKEITSAEKAARLVSMELDALNEKIEKRGKELAEKENELEKKAGELKALKDGLGDKEAEWERARQDKALRREAVSKELKPHLLKNYERIKSRRGGVGIVNVRDETCLGCYIQIPPQVYIQLRRGPDEIITCPHCHRILYFEDAGQEGEASDTSGVA